MSRCNFDGWSDVIGEVPWCLSMQTTVRHEAELESDLLWHVQPVQFVVQECRQTTVKLPRGSLCGHASGCSGVPGEACGSEGEGIG